MTRRQIERLLDHMVETHPEDLGGACIASTKIAVAAFRAKGVRARPLPVKTVVYSPALAQRMFHEDRHPDQPGEDPDEWRRAGCLAVMLGHGLGYGLEPWRTGWDGHLVAIIDERYFLDLTIGQAERLHWGLRLESHAFWVEPPRDFIRGRQDRLVLTDDGGSTVLYTPDPTNKAFLTAPAWDYKVKFVGGELTAW